MGESKTLSTLKKLLPRSRGKSNAAETTRSSQQSTLQPSSSQQQGNKQQSKQQQHQHQRSIITSPSSVTIANSVYSEKFDEFSRSLHEQPHQSTSDKYPVLKLNETLSVAIGDSFEANPGHIDSTSQFEYGGVRAPKTIRLLLILPAHDRGEPLETIMFHADLKEQPYQALSHTNRHKGHSRWVHCNGRGLEVSESMYEALIDVRNAAEPYTFSIVWAEAVCIDQSDIKDREAHLPLVRDIFTSAHVTLAHLGGTEEQGQKAFATLDMLYQACKLDEFRDSLEQDKIDLTSLDHLCIEDSNLEIPPENRLELTRLFSHHWFERIWNWQEVGLSKKVCIMYGGQVRTWGAFADVAWCMYHLRWEHSIGDDCLEHGMSRDDLKHYHILHLDEHRDGALHGSTFPLLSLLSESRHFTAAHPLDRVFALYSHIGNSREQDIIEAFFDYELPRLAMYLNITLNCILSHRTLDVLNLAHHDTSADPDWPSFVPDLARRDNMRTLGSKNGRRTWEYHACADTAPQLTIMNHQGQTREGIPFFNIDVHIMLKGLFVDEIAAVGSEMKGPSFGATPFLADWVNTALMTEGQKFYTSPELKRARELLAQSIREQNAQHGGSNGAGASGSSDVWVARRTSLAASRVGGPADSRAFLRNSFAPTLMDALKKLELEAKTSPSASARDASGEVDSMAILPHDRAYPVSSISVVEAFWRTLIKNQDGNGQQPTSEFAQTHFTPWFKAMSGAVSHMLEALAHGHSGDGEEDSGSKPEPLFNDLVHVSCSGTRIMRTRSGFIGTVPRTTKKGDVVCVLYGGQTPFVLRPSESRPGMYRLIGDTYVHGLMEGEALSMRLQETKFEIF